LIQKIEWKHYRLIFFLLSFGVGFIASLVMVSYAINFDALNDRIVTYTKVSYMEGCVQEGDEVDPNTKHFNDCHLKGEFFSADVRYILFQDPKVVQMKLPSINSH
jgi:hypothetical protein